VNTWVKVARYNLVRPANYLFLLWILPFSSRRRHYIRPRPRP